MNPTEELRSGKDDLASLHAALDAVESRDRCEGCDDDEGASADLTKHMALLEEKCERGKRSAIAGGFSASELTLIDVARAVCVGPALTAATQTLGIRGGEQLRAPLARLLQSAIAASRDSPDGKDSLRFIKRNPAHLRTNSFESHGHL